MIAVGTIIGLLGVWLMLCDKHNGAAGPLMLIGLLLMLTGGAFAHDHNRPGLDGWYQGLRSPAGSPCCDGPAIDAVHPEVVSWLVAKTVYADSLLEGARILSPLRELHMTALRNKSERATFRLRDGNGNGFVVDYSEDVTEEQVRKLDDLVRKEFETGNWVTVEQES
jgi:hypothetical protein